MQCIHCAARKCLIALRSTISHHAQRLYTDQKFDTAARAPGPRPEPRLTVPNGPSTCLPLPFPRAPCAPCVMRDLLACSNARPGTRGLHQGSGPLPPPRPSPQTHPPPPWPRRVNRWEGVPPKPDHGQGGVGSPPCPGYLCTGLLTRGVMGWWVDSQGEVAKNATRRGGPGDTAYGRSSGSWARPAPPAPAACGCTGRTFP